MQYSSNRHIKITSKTTTGHLLAPHENRPKTGGTHAKKSNPERTHIVKTYLNDAEKTLLDVKFSHSGKHSIAAFLRALRALIIEGKVYDMDYSFMREYNIKLGNISSNINQIARRVNSTGSIYEADINALKKEIENVWLIQKSILSELPLPELSATSLIPKKRVENS